MRVIIANTFGQLKKKRGFWEKAVCDLRQQSIEEEFVYVVFCDEPVFENNACFQAVSLLSLFAIQANLAQLGRAAHS